MRQIIEINGIPIDDAYDEMSKEEFIAHIKSYMERAESRLSAWKAVVELTREAS